MNNIQIIEEEINILEKDLKRKKEERDGLLVDYLKAKNKEENSKITLENFEKERLEIFNEYLYSLFLRLSILVTTLLMTSGMVLFTTLANLIFTNIIETTTTSIIAINTVSAIIGAFTGLYIYGFATILLEDKINSKLKDMVSKQLENDPKYKSLLEKIEIIKKRLKQETIEREFEEERYRRTDKIYSDANERLKTKKLDYDYLLKENNPTKNTIHMTRNLKPNNN